MTEFGMLLGSLGLLQGSRFAFSLLVAASVPLAAFTQWGLVLALLTYAPMLLLGSGNGMNRLVPLLRGRGDEAGSRRVTQSAWTVAAVATFLLVALALTLAVQGVPLASMLALLAALVCIYQVQQFSLRSQMRFGAASVQQGIFGLAVGLGCVALVALRPGDLGSVIGWYAAAHLVVVLLGLLLAPPHFGSISRVTIAYIVQQGAPVMLAGLLFGVLATLDRWVVALTLGPAESAPYTLASIVSAAILLVPTVVGQQAYPRMARRFGEEGDISGVTTMATSQNRTATLATLGPAIFLVAIGLVALPAWLPEYSEAVGPFMILGAAWCIYATATGWANLLIVIGRQGTYLAIQATVLAAAPVLLFVGATVAGRVGVSIGMMSVMIIYAGLLSRTGRRLASGAAHA